MGFEICHRCLLFRWQVFLFSRLPLSFDIVFGFGWNRLIEMWKIANSIIDLF